MQQQNFEFHSDTPLKSFIESLILAELEVEEIDYSNDKHVQTTLKKITSICDVLPGFFREKNSKHLVQLFNLFSHNLSEERVSLFYYDTFIKSQNFINHQFLKNVVATHIDNFPIDEWRQQLLRAVGIKKSSNSYSDKAYSSDYTYTALSTEEKNKADEYYQNFFKQYVLSDLEELSMNDMLQTLIYIVKDIEKKKFDSFVSKEEFTQMLKQMSYKIAYPIFAEDINKSEYSVTKEGVNLARTLYKEIFNSTHFYKEEKHEILYNTLSIDKNHFYNNAFTVKEIIRAAKTESVQEMFETITFPIGFTTQSQIVLELANAKNITKGVGIRLADFFLDLCEKNFEVGKMVVENFLPSIKQEMFLDAKTHELEGMDFLMAYCVKKQKSSVTISGKYQAVHKTMTNYEKERLTKQLQESQLAFVFKKEKFKL